MNRFPVRVHARRDPDLSRWLWLVEWLLLIPPPAIFAFNVGVLRWSSGARASRLNPPPIITRRQT